MVDCGLGAADTLVFLTHNRVQLMATLDWMVMLGTLLFIVVYGIWKTRGSKDIEGYLRGDNSSRWWTIGLSVMATQASAITFLSTPGQAYGDGMRFVQFYFGLPLAMIIISVFFIPIFYRLKVYTAYEYLESRFDAKTRVLTASLFLLQRGLAAGITIYAPAIILSSILGWSLSFTILFIGGLVIAYTVSGGARAVAQTHKQQMAVIFAGLFIAFGLLVYYLSEHVSFHESLLVAGNAGKVNAIDWEFDLSNRYNIWSGIIGGLFLQLSYFGTDQSQVQRYLSGTSVRESRLGLLFNGLVKIPMQFFILLTGVLVFVFFEFQQPPAYFNQQAWEQVKVGAFGPDAVSLEGELDNIHATKQALYANWLDLRREGDYSSATAVLEEIVAVQASEQQLKEQVQALVAQSGASDEGDDLDYVFITWVMTYLPVGLVGLLLAVIFSGAMSSTSAELNALASTVTVDIHKRFFSKDASDMSYVWWSKGFTILFGLVAIGFALIANRFENLIEAVNILGSLFYGTILGIFLVAFFVKQVTSGWAVFIAALLTEATILVVYRQEWMEYLWLNFLGCALVVVLSLVAQLAIGNKTRRDPQA